MATPFPVPAPGDVWGQKLIDIITEHKDAAVEEALAAVVDPGSEAGEALSAAFAPVPGPATALPVWNHRRVMSQLDRSPARVLCIGDSTTAGVYSDSYTTDYGTGNQGGPNSYPAQLSNRLTAGGLASDYGFSVPGHINNDDSRWNLGQWAYANFFAASNAGLTSGIPGAVLTFTSGVVADSYKVIFWSDAPATFSIQATGGSVLNVDTESSRGGAGVPPTLRYSEVVTAASASASNVVTITNGTSTNFIAGIEYWNSAAPNKVRVLNAGVGSATAASWANPDAAGSLPFIKLVAPDLTIISLGINDGAGNVPLESVLNSLEAVIATAKLSGDVILMSAFPHGHPSILDTFNATFKDLGYPYVDIQGRWGHDGEKLKFLTVDNTHPNAVGYGDIATAVSRHLLDA